MNLLAVLCLLSAILPSPGVRCFDKKIFSFFQIKSKIHLIIPVFSLFSCSFLEKAPFFPKIIPPQNSQNAPFSSKIMKKCVPEIPTTQKTPEIIPSGNSTGSSPASPVSLRASGSERGNLHPYPGASLLRRVYPPRNDGSSPADRRAAQGRWPEQLHRSGRRGQVAGDPHRGCQRRAGMGVWMYN